MEDEVSKIRRNLVAVSAAIMLAWWLQAPLDKISEKVLGTTVGSNFEWRAWFAATIVLLYFALRFRFSKEHTEAIAEMENEAGAVGRRLLLRWMNWETTWYVRWGYLPRAFRESFPIIIGASPDDAARNRRITRVDVANMVIGQRDSVGQVLPPSKGQVLGTVDIDVYRIAANRSEHRGLAQIGFDLSRMQRWSLRVWTYLWLGVYSRASTWLMVPWTLTACALAVCIWKQVRTLA